jgi:iron complex outermembrane receptor protein
LNRNGWRGIPQEERASTRSDLEGKPMKINRLLSTSALCSAALVSASLIVAMPAHAQDAGTTPDDPIADSGEPTPETIQRDEQGNILNADNSESTEEAIVITGSRIRRNEATSASPLLIIDPVLSQRQGRFDTAEMIQNSPIASGSGQITSAVSTNGVSNGGPGAQTISLRGLGAERTLVLLNSRRAGPAGTRGAVASFDLNAIPSSMIRSVEVLKDGASSIYGSDAVAGVVNILTKTDTDGIEFNGFTSIPTRSGGETYNINATWGKDFGRGHIIFAADYYKRKELKRKDRPWLGCDQDRVFRTERGGERADQIDPRTGEYTCQNGAPWGHVWAYSAFNLPDSVIPDEQGNLIGSVTLLQYNYEGILQNYLPGAPPATDAGHLDVPAGWFPILYTRTPTGEIDYENAPNAYALGNSYHPFEQKASFIPETDRYTLYGDGAFQITDGIEVYAEGLFNRRRTYQDYYSQFYNFGYTDLFADDDPENPYPGWHGVGYPAFISPTGLLDEYDRTTTVDYYRGVAGVRGDIDANWKYDLYGQYSVSKGKYKLEQILQDAIYQQTLRGFGFPCAGEVTPISGRQCVQINWVDPRVMAGALTEEELGYLIDTEVGKTTYKQKFIEGSVSGDLFELPAGPLGVALGAVWRRDSIDDQPGHITMAANPDYDPTDPDSQEFIDNAFANDFSSGHTFGHSITKEAFAEVNVPVFKDAPFAQSFTLSGAARITNVKAVRGVDGESHSSNGNWTYKLMGNWQVNDWVRFRATYGTSYRAPALFEQFLADQQSDARQIDIDPCVRWAEALVDGTITQRIADNCAAEGIPAGHTGGGIQADVFTSGGLGELEPETSTAKTASIILTPRFAFLPETDIAFTVDYFDIKVKDEIQILNPLDILTGCYNSDNFPNDPRCELFERGQDGNPNNVKSVQRKYINIDEQRNKGFDFTLRIRQGLGNMGSLSILGQATLQTKDTINRLGEFDNFNGDVADPKFTGQLHVNWEKGDTSVFYGMDFIGKQSSVDDFVELNGSLCNLTEEGQAIFEGNYCYRPWFKARAYHSLSLTQKVMDQFEFTLGVSNIFDKGPPRASGVTKLGDVSYYATMYDMLGRRVFVSAKAKF